MPRLAPRSSRFSVALAVAAALSTPALAAAGAPAGTPAAAVCRWLQPHLEGGQVESAVVAHVTADTLVVAAFGVTAAGEAPDAGTRYPIGSVTKVLTNLLLQEMADAGLVSPHDTLGALLPPEVSPRNPALPGITLRQLGTHTSGLARMPVNLFPRDPAQPFADYDEGRLWEGLALARAGQPLGRHYAYSNLGLGLLGHLLGRLDGRGYCEALRARVLAPRGLDATGCEPGDATIPWRFQSLAGAGAVWSSAEDLARLIRLTLDLPGDDPGLAVLATPGGHELTPVWQVARADGEPVYWHNGSIQHGQAFVGVSRSAGVGLVVLVAGSADPTATAIAALGARWADPAPLPAAAGDLHGQYQATPLFGVGIFERSGRLLAQLSGQTVDALHPVGDGWWACATADVSLRAVRDADGAVKAVEIVQHGRVMRAERTADQALAARLKEIAMPAERLADYVGRYRLSSQMVIEVERRADRLWVQLTGQPAMPVFPFEDDGFFYRAVDARLRFERGGDGTVLAVTLLQGGLEMRAERE